jgi:hypothetical protein
MESISVSSISEKAKAKARRFAFEVNEQPDGSFKIRGKEYIGRVTGDADSEQAMTVDCTCPAETSCYHMPHYVAAFRQAEMIKRLAPGTVIKYQHNLDHEYLPDPICKGTVAEVTLEDGQRLIKLQGIARPLAAFRVVGIVRQPHVQAAPRRFRRSLTSGLTTPARNIRIASSAHG